MDATRGDFIDNTWIRPTTTDAIRSVNPATDGDVVVEARVDPSHARLAVDAARRAWPAWAALSSDERLAALRRFARELAPRGEALARAITREMGKPIREARAEAQSLVARIDMVAEHQLPLVRPWSPPGVDGECRYHPLGVLAVLGPFNYPLHLVHAHVIPALATGNTVVIKPSERTPLSAQRYIEALEAAGLPPIVQMIQGSADVGRALIACPGVDGVAFTGSWRAGHAIERALVDRPEVLTALEMGGQNMAIVLADADLDQALEGVLLGAFLSAGQRCTCTARVLVERRVADVFISRLIAGARELTFGDPFTDVFMGPMASAADRDRVDMLCQAGVDAGAEVLLAATHRPGGAWRGPSIHAIAADHDSDYTREEVFGPDLALTIVDDLDEALDVVNASPYGLSVSVFTARRAALERVYLHTRVGCVNWNRSTNRASGAMPFGGVKRSGNYRPAGSDAVRYTTYPVQLQWAESGVLEGDPFVRGAIHRSDPITALEVIHRIEEACDPYGVYPDVDPNGTIRIPTRQLDHSVDLSRPLLEALRERRVEADLGETSLRIRLPAGTAGARELAESLADALYAIRPHHPSRFLGRRPRGAHVPPGDKLSLPRSEALHRRLVAQDFVLDDRKPPVIDLFRSAGAYLASVDDDPLVIFDAASQIATHAAGLNPPTVLAGLWEGRFGTSPIDVGDRRETPTPEMRRLAATLRREAGAHPWVGFCNSGGEANELAFAVCATRRPGRRAVVAFEGAFHGRTMLALHTTWNPAKRQRFELAGHEARWVTLPLQSAPHLPAPEPEGWLDAWRDRLGDARPIVAAPRDDGDQDPLLAAEIAALANVERALADDKVVCVIAEPMQSEGGEGYASARFFRGLRVLTEAWGVPLVMDEVQTGFQLGGPFFWSSLFDLPSPPDVITCAKKAQVGAAISRWPIPVSAEVHTTSIVRGTLNTELLAQADPASMIERVAARLAELAARHPTTVLSPRQTHYAFGFDLPDSKALAYVVDQRLWRGYMLYGAGDRALRFRLNPEMSPEHIEGLFARLDESLTDLERGTPAGWREGATHALPDLASQWPVPPAGVPSQYRMVRVDRDGWAAVRAPYEALQRATYEPARQDDFEYFTALMEDPDAICFVALLGGELPPRGKLVGACVGFPLEHFGDADGPRQDPSLGRGDTLYSADVTVHGDHRRLGIGRALKQAQIAAAMTAVRADGTPRYEYVTGRNRVGATTRMKTLNRLYGAAVIARYAGQYGEDGGAADYYRVPLTTPRLPEAARVPAAPPARLIDLDPGLERRLGDVRDRGEGVDELIDGFHEGRLNGAIVNKLSLCNFVTPGVVRAFEMLRTTAPKGLDHLVMASGRAEMLDKTLRSFKYHRRAASVVLSLGPVSAGVSTAAARSVTLPANDVANWFRWPTLTDPTVDPDQALADLRREIAARGAAQILAVVIEPVYEATGRAVPDNFWRPLRDVCDELDVPLALIENTTAGYRSGRGFWRADALPIQADAAMWYPGGQLGLGFVGDRHHVDEKLTLISTWSGDEVSLTRLLWELRVARTLPISHRAQALHTAIAPLGPVHGAGLYRTVSTPHAAAIARRLAERGLRVGTLGPDLLRVAPPLNVTLEQIEELAEAAREVGL